MPSPLRLSLVCFAHELRDAGVNYRTLRYRDLVTRSPAGFVPVADAAAPIAEIVEHNLTVAARTLDLCVRDGIQGMRLSNSMFPLLMSHPELDGLTFDDLMVLRPAIRILLGAIGSRAATHNIRLSYHANHYLSLTAANPTTLECSRRDLDILGQSLDLMGMPRTPEAPINLHLRGEGKGARDAMLDTFCEQFHLLSESVRSRLVVEQDDNADGLWSLATLAETVHEKLGVPLTYDHLHQRILPGGLSPKEAFLLAYETWPCEPLFHYAEGASSLFDPKHAEMPTALPPEFCDLPVTWEVEFKGKERAVHWLQKTAREPKSRRLDDMLLKEAARVVLLMEAARVGKEFTSATLAGYKAALHGRFPDGLGETVRTVTSTRLEPEVLSRRMPDAVRIYRDKFPKHRSEIATQGNIAARIYEVWVEARKQENDPDHLYLGTEEYEALRRHLMEEHRILYPAGDEFKDLYHGMRVHRMGLPSLIRVEDSRASRRFDAAAYVGEFKWVSGDFPLF